MNQRQRQFSEITLKFRGVANIITKNILNLLHIEKEFEVKSNISNYI